MPDGQNPYDFILNSSNQPKKSGLGHFLSSPQNKTQRIIFIAAGGVILLMLALIVFSLIFSSGGGNRDQLLGLAQRHAELVRVSDIGLEKSRDSEARNLAATTKLSLQSSQSNLMTIVNKTGKVGNKELSAGQDPETDKALEAAERNNRFDEAFIQILSDQLQEYQTELKATHSASSSAANKQTYSNILNQVGALLPEQTEAQ